MHTEINPKTQRAVKVYDTVEERLAAQNQQYARWIEKVRGDAAKLASYKARKNAASKRCNEKRKQLLAEAAAIVASRASES